MISEVALALVAIIGAGLFLRSFQMARKLDTGFDARGVVVAHLYLASEGYSVPERIQFLKRVQDRLAAAPGIQAVSYADHVPLGFAEGSWENLQVDGYVPKLGENMNVFRTVTAPDFFNVLRIPLLDGRDFTAKDDQQSQPVMIVNRKFAQRFFKGENPIGRKVRGWGQSFTIVGLVKDAKFHLRMKNSGRSSTFRSPK